MSNSLVRAAVVQAAPVVFDTPRTLAKLIALTGQAAAQGADIIVFPEAFVGGYPKGLDFGARLVLLCHKRNRVAGDRGVD